MGLKSIIPTVVKRRNGSKIGSVMACRNRIIGLYGSIRTLAIGSHDNNTLTKIAHHKAWKTMSIMRAKISFIVFQPSQLA